MAKKDRLSEEERIQKIIEKAKQDLAEEAQKASSTETSTNVQSTVEVTEVKPSSVRVATTVNRRCFIGNQEYTFKKDVPQYVPINVRNILKAGKILKAEQ